MELTLVAENRFVWAMYVYKMFLPRSNTQTINSIMAQLTIARFRGDTAFGQVVRILGTFLGGIVGMLIWFVIPPCALHSLCSWFSLGHRYIASGDGNGSPYGLAATLAVCFPFLLFARLYWPGPPMQILIFLMTTMLVSFFLCTVCMALNNPYR